MFIPVPSLSFIHFVVSCITSQTTKTLVRLFKTNFFQSWINSSIYRSYCERIYYWWV